MYEHLHKTIPMVQSESFHLARWYKYVQIQSFFWSVFSPNARKYGPEKTTYLDTFAMLQVVTMCLPSNKSSEEITRSIIDLATSIKKEKYDFSISNIIIPADHKKLEEEGCEVYNFLGNWVTFQVSLAFPEK